MVIQFSLICILEVLISRSVKSVSGLFSTIILFFFCFHIFNIVFDFVLLVFTYIFPIFFPFSCLPYYENLSAPKDYICQKAMAVGNL